MYFTRIAINHKNNLLKDIGKFKITWAIPSWTYNKHFNAL